MEYIQLNTGVYGDLTTEPIKFNVFFQCSEKKAKYVLQV